jgi:hypothetical protein
MTEKEGINSPPVTRTVETEVLMLDGKKVEQGWFFQLSQDIKKAAKEGEQVQFGWESHSHLFDQTGRLIGWRVRY